MAYEKVNYCIWKKFAQKELTRLNFRNWIWLSHMQYSVLCITIPTTRHPSQTGMGFFWFPDAMETTYSAQWIIWGEGFYCFLKQSRSVWGLEWQSWRVKSSLWTGMIFFNFFWKSSSDFLLYLSTEMVGWCFITHYVGWTWGEPISALHWDTLLVGTAKLQTYVMDQATLTCKAQPRETDTACLGLL